MGGDLSRGQRKESRGQDGLQSLPPPPAGRLGAYLIRWREIAKLELATYTERPSARPWARGGLRTLRNCGGKRIWQPDFLWLYPRLISLQCSVCAWMEMIPALRGTGVRKSKPHAPRKKGEGISGGGRQGGRLVLSATFSFFFFRRGLSSFCFMTSKSPPQACLSHLPSAAELIKHQKTAHQFCLVRSLTY